MSYSRLSARLWLWWPVY